MENLITHLQSLPFSTYLERFIIIILILIAYKILERIARHRMQRLSKKQTLNRKQKTLVPILFQVTKIILVFIAIFLILATIGIPTTPLIAITGSAGFILGMGAQQVVKDLINGFLIFSENQFNVGDRVELADVEGQVLELGLRTTTMRNLKNGEVIIIPNSEIKKVKNLSGKHLIARVDMQILPIYHTDKLLKYLETELASLYDVSIMLEKPKLVGVTSINFHFVTITITCEVIASEKFAIETLFMERTKAILDDHQKDLLIQPKTA